MTIHQASNNLRPLSATEIMLVAGGLEEANSIDSGSGYVDTRGVNELVNRSNYEQLTSDGVYGKTDGYIVADYNLDGVYDQAWYADGSGAWHTSYTGDTWQNSSGPMQDIYRRWGVDVGE